MFEPITFANQIQNAAYSGPLAVWDCHGMSLSWYATWLDSSAKGKKARTTWILVLYLLYNTPSCETQLSQSRSPINLDAQVLGPDAFDK